MSQDDNDNPSGKDKTQLQNSGQNPQNKKDSTRLSPPRLKVGKRSITDKAAANTTAKTTDKTRLAPSVPPKNLKKPQLPDSSSVSNTDKTVYRQKPQARDAQTRIAPPANRDSKPLAGTERQNVVDNRRVLKERFVLEDVLGVGGMGVVYKARDLLKVEAQDRDPYVAIKVLSEEFKSHPEAFISLQRESRKSQRIQHANIVNVYDFDRDGETVFMTMEFLDGDPLDDLIARYKSTGLPTDDAWEVIRGMISALISAHDEKIIHSDFKPGNVFVTNKGLAKVFDFGIARAVAQVEQLEGSKEDQTLFDAGNLGALTPAYASLEMLEGKEPDVRDDLYALGCVIYEVLTGEHPYNKVPADEASSQGLKAKKINHIKKFQWRAIEKAISFKREDRPATVKEFRNLMTPKIKSSNWLVSGIAIAFALAVTAYFLVLKKEPVVNEFSEFDIRNELELKIRIDFLKKDIDLLLTDSNFTSIWQDAIWRNFSDLDVLTKGEDEWVLLKKENVYQLYIQQIENLLRARNYSNVDALIINAQRYSANTDKLTELSSHLNLAIKQAEAREKVLRKQQAEAVKRKKLNLQQRRRKRDWLNSNYLNKQRLPIRTR